MVRSVQAVKAPRAKMDRYSSGMEVVKPVTHTPNLQLMALNVDLTNVIPDRYY